MDVDERPLRVMADANIIIAGVFKPRWFFEFLGHALRGDFQLVLASQTVAEVLRWAEAKGRHRQSALEFFLVTCRFELAPDPSREEVQANITLVRDVTDVPVALSALKARVDYLVTNDRFPRRQHKGCPGQRRHPGDARRHLPGRSDGMGEQRAGSDPPSGVERSVALPLPKVPLKWLVSPFLTTVKRKQRLQPQDCGAKGCSTD